MVLQLRQLFDVPGDEKDVDFDISFKEIDEARLNEKFVTPIAVKGQVVNRAGIVSFNYSCKFTLCYICDRCLKEFNQEYQLDFSHILIQSRNTQNDEYIVCGDNALDINELAISDLLLQLPTKILCRQDCKGLCYVCGQDLNEGECNCS